MENAFTPTLAFFIKLNLTLDKHFKIYNTKIEKPSYVLSLNAHFKYVCVLNVKGMVLHQKVLESS